MGLRLQAPIVVLLDRDPRWADSKLRPNSEKDPRVEPSPRLLALACPGLLAACSLTTLPCSCPSSARTGGSGIFQRNFSRKHSKRTHTAEAGRVQCWEREPCLAARGSLATPFWVKCSPGQSRLLGKEWRECSRLSSPPLSVPLMLPTPAIPSLVTDQR